MEKDVSIEWMVSAVNPEVITEPYNCNRL